MTEILITNRGQFYDLIEGDNQVVALFTAPTWCVPCRRFEPHWEQAIRLSETNGWEFLFVKVDMGERPEDTGQHWASKDFSILGVPTVKRFFDEDNHVDIKARAVVPFIKELNG